MKKISITLGLIIALIQPSQKLFADSIVEQLEKKLSETEQSLTYVSKDHAYWDRLADRNTKASAVAAGVGLATAITAFMFLLRYPGSIIDQTLSVQEAGGLIVLIAGVPTLLISVHLDYTALPPGRSPFPKELFEVSAQIQPDGRLILTTFAKDGYPLTTLQFDEGIKGLIQHTVRQQGLESLPFLDFMLTYVDQSIIETPLTFQEEEISLGEWAQRFWDTDKPGLLATLFRPAATRYFMQMAYLYDFKGFILQQKKRLLIREIACRKPQK